MKALRIRGFVSALAAAGLLASTGQVGAQVITADPSLPVLYPAGFYATPAGVLPTYNGPGLTVVLSNVQHQAFGPVTVLNIGPNEQEQFNSGMNGLLSVNGSPFVFANATGPVDTLVYGKVGNITGTFQTEMLSLSLSGSSPFGPFLIRESPTLPSLGQTTISNIGGGLFHIDSFFDVFTELSVDNGATWIPSQGPTHMDLTTPEPSILAVVGLFAGLFVLRGLQKRA